VIVLLANPAVTVIVAVLPTFIVFAVAVSVKVPSFIPLAGATVTHGELLETIHKPLAWTDTDVHAAALSRFHVTSDTLKSCETEPSEACDTVIVLVMPPPVTVTVPVLPIVPGFAAAHSVNVPLPVPLPDMTVSQDDALLVAVHNVFDETDMVVFDAPKLGSHVVGVTVSVGVSAAAACDTAIVLVMPPPVTVTVAILLLVLVFAAAHSANEPLPVPLPDEIVSQDGALLDAVHDVFDATDTDVLDAPALGFHVVGVTVSVAAVAACVTVIVLVMPPPVTVTVPTRLLVLVFAVAHSVSEPLPIPLTGEIVSQEGELLDAVHDVFDATDTVVFDALALGPHAVVATVSVAAGAACVTVIVLVIPPPVTVTVPVRLLALVFVAAHNVSEPLPIPLLGEIVSQEGALLDAVHVVFDATDTVVFVADALGLHAVGVTVSIGVVAVACMTVIVFVMPPPVTVIVPVRLLVLVFAVVHIARESLPVPLPDEIASQVGVLLYATHDAFDTIFTTVLDAFAPKFHVIGVTLSVAVGETCVTVT
jgi:hypothetical protein